jgi:hypothetical protein
MMREQELQGQFVRQDPILWPLPARRRTPAQPGAIVKLSGIDTGRGSARQIWDASGVPIRMSGVEDFPFVSLQTYATRHKMPKPDACVGATKLWRQQTIKE